MRYCEADTKLDSGAEITKGERVVCLIGVANRDKEVFNEPFRFSFDPNKRKIEKYLLFNEEGNPRKCWGRDRVAMVVLRECLMAASRLQGLRKAAGKGGDPLTLFRVTVSLPARFTRVAASSPVVASQAPSSKRRHAKLLTNRPLLNDVPENTGVVRRALRQQARSQAKALRDQPRVLDGLGNVEGMLQAGKTAFHFAATNEGLSVAGMKVAHFRLTGPVMHALFQTGLNQADGQRAPSRYAPEPSLLLL